jgi:hypothetical protein
MMEAIFVFLALAVIAIVIFATDDDHGKSDVDRPDDWLG